MSKDFFAVLAEQLCSIRNSPFSLLSKQSNHDLSSSHLLRSNRLSYDPDRLFNPQKSSVRVVDDPAYLEIERQQKEQLQKIQIQLLRQRTHEVNFFLSQQLQKLKQTTQLTKGYSFNHPFSIFKVDRTLCTNCNKCYEYNGNFNIGSTLILEGTRKQVEYLCCMACSCPMNSHQPLIAQNKFSSDIFNFLSTATLENSHLNTPYFPICFAKEFTKQSNLLTLLGNFFNLLPQLGFNIISYNTLTKKQFELFMIKKQILAGTEKETVERLMSFVSFLEHQQAWDWKQELPEGLDQDYFDIVKKLRMQLKLSIKSQEQVVVFFVHSINHIDSMEISQILTHYSSALGARFLWTPKEAKEMFLSSCLLFPQHYQLNHQIFVLPSQNTHQQMDKATSRFKDLLDYNNYVTIGQIKSIKSDKLEQMLKHEDPNKLNYIMGRDQVNDVVKRVRILLSAKVGPSIFTIPFKNAVDFIEISSEQKMASFMMAFPQYLRSQRCMIVLRPSFTLSNLDEIIMTLLRVNNFVMLKRRRVILSSQEAQYLATLEKISQNNLEAYVKMMTSGASEIVLVSKRAAIYEANILLNGSRDSLSDTNVKIIRDIPTIKIKRGTESYEYQPIIKPYESEKKQCFSSINELFKVQHILFPQSKKEFKFMTNERNGEVIKVDNEQLNQRELKMSSKIKESMLKEIKRDTFNYWAYSSKSEFLTEELAGIFIPDTTLFESCVVIVKPGFVHLAQKIRQALVEHRYHIIMEKTVLLSQKLAYEMVMNLQKTTSSNSELKRYVGAYSSENIHIFCISKVFAKQQILSILSEFSFLSSMSTIVTDYVDDSLLKQVLIPVWNNQQFVLKILSAPLYNIEEAINSLYAPDISNQDKFEILMYMIGSYFGVSIEDLSLNSIIGKFSYYITTTYVANLQSWFYSQISKLSSRYVPTLFQHRMIGETCFVIQSYFGFPFLNLISTQYKEEKEKVTQVLNKQSRKSLILFLWGKQLAKFIHNVSQKPSEMKGWGKLVKRNDEWQGKNSQKELFQLQRDFLQQSSQRFQNTEYQIHLYIRKVLQSRFLNEKYNQQSRRKLIPHFIEGKIDECIRIIQTQEISKLHLVDKYSMIDPEHQRSNQKSLYTLTLYNVEPSIGTKEELIVEVMMFLLRLQRDNEEFKEMFSILFLYFVQHILEFSQADVLESEFYIRLLKQYTQTNEDWLKQKLRTYPNLKKLAASNNATINDQMSGKKRKFLQKRQYYKDMSSNLTEDQKHIKNKEYKSFNLNYEAQEKEKDFDKNNPLLNMKDPFHRKITLEERPISLLREGQQFKMQKTGIYVEFQKKITQNEELLMNKVKGQVDKFNLQREDKILYQTGLQNQLWYRKTKGEKAPGNKNKVEDAIQKQISKLLQFKQTGQGFGDNKFSQTR